MRMSIIGAVAAALSLTAAHGALAPRPLDAAGPRQVRADEEGTWIASDKGDGQMELSLQWGSSLWVRTIDRADLQGLDEAALHAAAATPVRFRIEREPGVLGMEGSFRAGRGTGQFRFERSGDFVSTLRSLGIHGAETVGDGELVALALADAKAADVRALATLELEALSVGNLVALSLHGATAEYVRSIRSLGVQDVLSANHLVGMRIHGVTPEFVRSLEALGYRALSRQQLVAMRIHGVSPAFIREVRAAGVREATPEALVRMRIRGIDAGRGRSRK